MIAALSGMLPAWPAAGQAGCESALEGRRFTLVVPYAPGGGWDAYARVFDPVFEAHTGANLIVRNLVGAGGMRGIRVAAQADPEDLMLVIFNPTSLADSRRFGLDVPGADAFLLLGSFLNDSLIVVGQSGLNAYGELPFPLVAGAVDTELTRTMLAMESLGWDIRPVLGFSGSADRWMALLRGDIDIMVGTTNTMVMRLQSAPEYRPLVSLTQRPNRHYPDAPFLSGPGGLVDRLTTGLPEMERSERLRIAQLAVDISAKPRALAITATIDGMLRECLVEGVEDVLFSDALRQGAADANLDFDPRTGEQVEQTVSGAMSLLEQHSALIDQVMSAP